MKIKKLISSLLATTAIAFSSPLAFAQWTAVDINPKMINFEVSGKKIGVGLVPHWKWLNTGQINTAKKP